MFFIGFKNFKEGSLQYTMLKTNFPPLFWKRLKEVIRQKKKRCILELLFGTFNLSKENYDPSLEDIVKNIQTKLNI